MELHKLIYILIIITSTSLNANSQQSRSLPASFKTTYEQSTYGLANGQQHMGDPSNECIYWHFDKIREKIIPQMKCNSATPDRFIITESQNIIETPTGWSVKFHGYDPKYPEYMANGVLVDNVVLHLIYSNGAYSVLYITSTIDQYSGQTIMSTIIKYY